LSLNAIFDEFGAGAAFSDRLGMGFDSPVRQTAGFALKNLESDGARREK
jgi:hypothetical protein